MQNRTRTATTLIAAALLAGCASPYPVGLVYTDIALPLSVTGTGGGGKQGQASCQTLLNVLATGDCSIETARKNGEISTITHMDWKVDSVFGIISNYTLTVYGD